jgi:hypothetical protein
MVDCEGLYKSADRILKKARQGDIIEFNRIGHLHFGIFDGFGNVIHVDDIRQQGKALVT